MAVSRRLSSTEASQASPTATSRPTPKAMNPTRRTAASWRSISVSGNARRTNAIDGPRVGTAT
jgi:hypothetical protein